MRIDVYHHFPDAGQQLAAVLPILNSLLDKVNVIMTTQTQLAAGLTAATEQLQKIATESSAMLQKVTDLEAALANSGNLSPEVETAFAALKQQIQTVDDLVPDAPAAAPGDSAAPTA